MSHQTRLVVGGLVIAAVACAAVLYAVPMAGQPEVRPDKWAMVPVESEHGYAYLYNRATGEVWMIQSDVKRLVKEPMQKQPTDPE